MKSFYVTIKAVFAKDGKVLILRRQGSDGISFYDMPGGKIDGDEDFEETLIREVSEELGLTGITVENLLTVFRLQGYNRDGHGLVNLYYRVTAPDFQIQLSDEHIGYEWVNTDDLLKMLTYGQIINEGVQMAVSLAAS